MPTSDGTAYITVVERPADDCTLLIDNQPVAPASRVRVEPGIHRVGCRFVDIESGASPIEVEVEVLAGHEFRLDYWGP